MGLQYVVGAAGATGAPATLLPVDDHATVEVGDRLRETLARGLSED